MNLKGRCFENVSDIQRESQAVLDSIKGNDFDSTFEEWGGGGEKEPPMGSLYKLQVYAVDISGGKTYLEQNLSRTNEVYKIKNGFL
jgi:hypothetical protein